MIGAMTLRLRGLARGRRIARFSADTLGVAAVEFAMVAVPFIGFISAIFQTAYVTLQATNLQKATLQAGRDLQTLNVSGSLTLSSFAQSHLCNRLSTMFTCSLVQVSLTTASGNNWSNAVSATTAGTFQTSGYNGGQALTIPAAGNVAVLRVAYPLNPIVAIIAGVAFGGQTITQIQAGQTQVGGSYVYVIYGTYAFQVEP